VGLPSVFRRQQDYAVGEVEFDFGKRKSLNSICFVNTILPLLLSQVSVAVLPERTVSVQT
jgi:hypothetical protein